MSLRKSLIPASRTVILGIARPHHPAAAAALTSLRYRTMATAAPAKKEFLCILPDKADALPRRLEVRSTHLADVKPLVAAGKVAAGGAMFEQHPAEGRQTVFKGSMIIYTVRNVDEAWELIRNDIYAKSDVWDLEKAQVIPYVSAVREAL
ncbi:Aspercryptin biosynthesis cluster protein B [Colletotrichum trifolii]|uniref:Aspercryptin biosynthesis cluster protein B n=1 Tax=Colletotrichum trifolii TaxID=5466 RepID=A0A4R8RCT3_COLTR|nr:Aspercryptin biosynthesis cluster protein B [Colletotrichum trifolii]